MPSKHSKNCGDKHHFTYAEKKKAKLGSVAQRLGADSQLPFGYCPLSLNPITDAVVSPSGHIYSRESILEYLLLKTQEIKAQARAFELQQVLMVFSIFFSLSTFYWNCILYILICRKKRPKTCYANKRKKTVKLLEDLQSQR